MVTDPVALIADFRSAAKRHNKDYSTSAIESEAVRAPHKPAPLPRGKCAVYVFSLSAEYGARCAAGAHRVLKVGKAGPNTNARFQSQHYNPGSSPSNLAKSLLHSEFLWAYFGIASLTTGTIGQWIKENTDRDHFYLDAAERNEMLGDLERYLKGVLGPAFEGS